MKQNYLNKEALEWLLATKIKNSSYDKSLVSLLKCPKAIRKMALGYNAVVKRDGTAFIIHHCDNGVVSIEKRIYILGDIVDELSSNGYRACMI